MSEELELKKVELELEKIKFQKWEKELELNKQLQQKKHKIRQYLHEKGILKKDKSNGNFGYFSDIAYKTLFTKLFLDVGLDFSYSVVDVERWQASKAKMSEGRIVKVKARFIDIETGYYEEVYAAGDGADFSDKGIYKAETGAVKYILACNFLVATGDDAEKDVVDNIISELTENQKHWIDTLPPDWLQAIDNKYGTRNLTKKQFDEVMKLWKERHPKGNKKQQTQQNNQVQQGNQNNSQEVPQC